MDFATREGNQIKLPDVAPTAGPPGRPPRHGIAVTADQKTLLVNSRLNSALYAYSLPDLKLGVALGGKGAGWSTITPDDKTAYVANEHTNDVGRRHQGAEGNRSSRSVSPAQLHVDAPVAPRVRVASQVAERPCSATFSGWLAG